MWCMWCRYLRQHASAAHQVADGTSELLHERKASAKLPRPGKLQVVMPKPGSHSSGDDTVTLGLSQLRELACAARASAEAWGIIGAQLLSRLPKPYSEVTCRRHGPKGKRNKFKVALVHKLPELLGHGSWKPSRERNESYGLSISSNELLVDAKTSWALANAIATLYQLLEVRTLSGQDTIITVPGCPHEIIDFPAFPHRGLLLDTSRTYYPVPWIKTLIASLAEFKINILHLHVTDTTSWPLEVEEFPELTERLSYRDNIGEKQIFSRADIRELVEYARLRGMSLLPEVDGPAHAPALATGKPLWLTAGGTSNYSTQSFGVEPPPGVWNLSNDSALQVVKSVLTQLQEDFSTSPFLHLGGDEPVAGAVCDTLADETQKELCLTQCTTLNGRTGSPWRGGCAVVPLRPADSCANVTWWFPEVLNALVQKWTSPQWHQLQQPCRQQHGQASG
ncbi:unnamed protein product [Polarella glacialis]|uniref:beta-N-acetylhexosaminidase n=1 Tax=Polarella glacialis TaxID=89957 RepID=A0A813D9D0_POLGL|nr:unnamed protein product [Polarella glacialis]